MSILSPSDQDVTKIQVATSKVIADAISSVVNVLLPAISKELGGAVSGLTLTIGPITIEPIKITIGAKDA